jgi:hypothetical protein
MIVGVNPDCRIASKTSPPFRSGGDNSTAVCHAAIVLLSISRSHRIGSTRHFRFQIRQKCSSQRDPTALMLVGEGGMPGPYRTLCTD